MAPPRVYVLGGHQTDFARHWTREGKGLFDMLREAVEGALEQTGIAPAALESAHVGNFVGELFCGQGQLGGFFTSIHPDFVGVPAMRHEAACASGSMAMLAGTAEIEAGRYELACVSGVEMMRNVDGHTAAAHLGAALWAGEEAQEANFPWPYQFSQIADLYAERYGLKAEHLLRIAEINFANAKRNPNAQTRRWSFTERSFCVDDEANPVVEGRLRKQDCGQITDGAAALLLASESYAATYAKHRGIALSSLPYIQGWGHRNAPMKLQSKIALGEGQAYPFPHLRRAIEDAYRRAGISGPDELDGVETHDCFSISEYVAIDHLGLTAAGEAWKAVEEERIAPGGDCPINASGGLIGCGHPVGATGVRMVLDAYKQTTGQAGDYQIDGAKRIATLNIGGSLTTVASFVVGVEG